MGGGGVKADLSALLRRRNNAAVCVPAGRGMGMALRTRRHHLEGIMSEIRGDHQIGTDVPEPPQPVHPEPGEQPEQPHPPQQPGAPETPPVPEQPVEPPTAPEYPK